jgi:hypothetical protein
MELAALSGDAGQGGPTGGLEAGMIVADDQLDTLQAAPDQLVEKGAHMDLGLGQGDRNVEHAAAPILGDAHRHQDGAIDQLAALANALIAGIEEQVRGLVERTLAPGQAGIELLGGPADLAPRVRIVVAPI